MIKHALVLLLALFAAGEAGAQLQRIENYGAVYKAVGAHTTLIIPKQEVIRPGDRAYAAIALVGGKLRGFDEAVSPDWFDVGGEVSSVFGRKGAVVAQAGDYTTTLVTEGTNLYYTDARARGAFTAGTNITITAGGVISSNIDLTSYYTKTNLQTSGQSQVHWGNLTNTPTTIGGYGITDFNSLGDARWAPASGSANYIRNQTAALQTPAAFRIGGNSTIEVTASLSPSYQNGVNSSALTLANTTPATSTVLQNSPALRWVGHSWNNGASAPTEWKADIVPNTGNNGSDWRLSMSNKALDWTEMFRVTEAGIIKPSGVISASIYTDASYATSNFSVLSANGTSGNSGGGGITLNSSGVNFRVTSRGTGALTASTNNSAAHWIIGTMGITEAASGTNPVLASFAIKAPTITNGAGATTIGSTLYIDGPPAGTSWTATGGAYAIYAATGNTYTGGTFISGALKTTAAAPAATGATKPAIVDENGQIGFADWTLTGGIVSAATAPTSPANGWAYYNTAASQFSGYRNGVWKNFMMDGDAAPITGGTGYIQNTTTPQTASFAVTGTARIDGTTTLNGPLIVDKNYGTTYAESTAPGTIFYDYSANERFVGNVKGVNMVFGMYDPALGAPWVLISPANAQSGSIWVGGNISTNGALISGNQSTFSAGAISIGNGTSDASALVLRSTLAAGAGVGPTLTFQGYGTGTTTMRNFASIAGKKENATDGNRAGYMAFTVTNSAGTLTEYMRISSAGVLTVNSLKTSVTAPVTTGTTKPVIVDANGAMSFTDWPAATAVGGTGAVQFASGTTITGNTGLFYDDAGTELRIGYAGVDQGDYKLQVNGGTTIAGTLHLPLMNINGSAPGAVGTVQVLLVDGSNNVTRTSMKVAADDAGAAAAGVAIGEAYISWSNTIVTRLQ